MPRTPSVVELPRRRYRRVLIVTEDDDDDDDGGSGVGVGGRTQEAGSVIAAGGELGGRRVKTESFHDLGSDGKGSGAGAPAPLQNPLAQSSSRVPVAVARAPMPPEVIVIDDDDDEGDVDGELQLGDGAGFVEEEPVDDFGVDWDDLLSSDDESSVAPGKARGGGSRTSGTSGAPGPGKVTGAASRRSGTSWQQGASDDEEGAEEVELEEEDEEEEEEEKEEEEWEEEEEEDEEEEEEEEEVEMEEDEVESEESDEAGEEPRRAPRDATAARRNARASDNGGTEIFVKRLFEGWCIAEKADTTAAGKPLAARTRSHRRCVDIKLLKQATRSKPYCVDTPSESSSDDTSPPPAQPQRPPPSLSSEDCEDDNGGRRAATRRRRRRDQNAAHSDDDFKEDSSGDHGTAARRRRHREQNADGGDDDDSEEDRAFVCSGRPKRGAASCRQAAVKECHKNHDASNHQRCFKNNNVPKTGSPTDGGCNQQGDVPFKKNSLIAPMRRRGRDRETYDDLIDSIFDGIESHLQDGSAPAQAQNGNILELPLIFSFGDEDEALEEKTEQSKFEDQLWAELDFALESLNVCYHICEEGEKGNGKEIPAGEATSCNRGKHDLIIDEQIGVRCKLCDFIDLEIRHVFPSMLKFSTEREPTIDRDLDLIFDDILKSMGYEEASNFGGHKTGLVWDLIPGVREDMFPHQQEGFEFMWKKLAGGIDIEQLKHTVNTDTISGCVISHAPGTGKTRLAITFVQSYLELFPQCRPVIIAPRGMLATWEQEFTKWNVKLPFHVLSSSEIQWNEDKTIQKLIAQDESLGPKLSMNKLSQKSRLMVKLASWYEGSSIIGLSYSLYRKLAKDEGMDGDTVRNLLLEKPSLLVLDEGHTPRNKKSLIWKVLAEVGTEKRIILSGTPFQNNFLELYNILCLVKPKFARDFACTRFNKKGLASKRTSQSRTTPHLEEDEGKEFWTSLRISSITDENISEIREKLDPFVHIHNGDILQKSLAGLRESVVILNPLPRQKEIIAMMEKSAGKGFLDAEYKISLASIHPFLVTSTKLSDEEASVVDKLKGLRLNPCEGVKTRFVLEIVRLCEALKERVLVFSQYLEPLSLIMDQLTRKFNWTEGKEISLMSGNVRVKQREALMEAFNDMNSEAKVMLASTKACCEGITLVGASRVILLDVVWNPSVGRQAIGRAYRIGQEKIVYTYNLIAEGTKEKVKYDRQAKKDHMSKLLFSNEPRPAGCNLPPELIFNDRILEAMTAHGELKDMFVQILPSH